MIALLALALALGPAEILRRVDEVRLPDASLVMRVVVTTRRPGRTGVSVYEVMTKGWRRTVVRTLEPKLDRGRVILMRDRDLWVYLPGLRKPLRISPRERLVGEVSYGDIARTSFSVDYSARMLREEAGCQVLELSAKGPGVTYQRVLLWVERNTFRPRRAEFYAVSGRLLKTCRYEGYREVLGALRPTRLVIRDALCRGCVSVLEYRDIRRKELPDRLFTKHALKRLCF